MQQHPFTKVIAAANSPISIPLFKKVWPKFTPQREYFQDLRGEIHLSLVSRETESRS